MSSCELVVICPVWLLCCHMIVRAVLGRPWGAKSKEQIIINMVGPDASFAVLSKCQGPPNSYCLRRTFCDVGSKVPLSQAPPLQQDVQLRGIAAENIRRFRVSTKGMVPDTEGKAQAGKSTGFQIPKTRISRPCQQQIAQEYI